jgi:DNA-binding transcriptional MerR regulator
MTESQDTRGLFDSGELERLEGAHADGISAQEVIALFQARGLRLSEANFRKYVQLGLLPTSRRVGRKGKHRGSRGLYPVSVVRSINLIKRLMDRGLTLEEIRDSFVSIQNDIERVGEALDSLFARIEERLTRIHEAPEALRPLTKDVEASRRGASILLESLEKIGSRLAVTGPTPAGVGQGGMS